MTDRDAELARILSRCRRDHTAWINGDGSFYALPDDGSIMGAVGGSSLGGDGTFRRQLVVARQWVSGTGEIELVNGSIDGDTAWLVMIERATVIFAGQSEPHRWDLRVTEIFHRDGEDWVRVHRHADPLVDRHEIPGLLSLFS